MSHCEGAGHYEMVEEERTDNLCVWRCLGNLLLAEMKAEREKRLTKRTEIS